MTKTKTPAKKPFPKTPKAQPLAETVSVPTEPIVMMTKDEVVARFKVSHVTIWNWVCEGKFPPPRQIGSGNGHRSKIVWLKHEIEAYIINSPQRWPKGRKVEAA
jgi:predicted DNA-binding transcriptional regulator AlpA